MPRKRESTQPKRPRGRPLGSTKLTPAITRRVCRLLGLGLGRGMAARRAGIGETTFYVWLQEGREEKEGIKRDFMLAVEAAEDRYCEQLASEVKRIALKGESDNVRLAASKLALERRYPTDWGARQETRLAGHDGGAVKVESDNRHRVESVITPEAAAGMTLEQLEAATRGAIEGDEAEEE